jgi:uncharacterized Zn-binding protein involved in type VI secretion
MPAVARLGDKCSGHGCHPPRPNVSGSGNVFINGAAAHRQGDGWAVHTCGKNTHGGSLSGGSGSVYANGQPLGRIGDAVSCGSAVARGSSNVFAG